jgi:hypothetical protein
MSATTEPIGSPSAAGISVVSAASGVIYLQILTVVDELDPWTDEVTLTVTTGAGTESFTAQTINTGAVWSPDGFTYYQLLCLVIPASPLATAYGLNVNGHSFSLSPSARVMMWVVNGLIGASASADLTEAAAGPIGTTETWLNVSGVSCDLRFTGGGSITLANGASGVISYPAWTTATVPDRTGAPVGWAITVELATRAFEMKRSADSTWTPGSAVVRSDGRRVIMIPGITGSFAPIPHLVWQLRSTTIAPGGRRFTSSINGLEIVNLHETADYFTTWADAQE